MSRWYMVTRDGAATLCADEADARETAAEADATWPHLGPHRAVQLVELSAVAGEVERLRDALSQVDLAIMGNLANAVRAREWVHDMNVVQHIARKALCPDRPDGLLMPTPLRRRRPPHNTRPAPLGDSASQPLTPAQQHAEDLLKMGGAA